MAREPSTYDEESTQYMAPANASVGARPGAREPGAPEERATLPVGATLGRYRIHDVLGQGGMGTVYAAHDRVLDRKVALKVMRNHGGHERFAETRDRMHREAQALARLSHPNVVTIFDVTVLDGQLVLAMELVEGPTLRGWLDERTRAHSEQVLANWERALGPEHHRLALPLTNLAVLARDIGDYDAALAYDLRAMAIRRKAFGSDHIEVAQSLGGIGLSMLHRGRCAEAVGYFREATEIYERLLGPDHDFLAQVLSNYALCQVELPDKEAALPLVERGLAIRMKVYGPESPDVRSSLHPMGVVQMKLGRPEQAIEALEHALRLEPGEGEEIEDADIRFDLAKALAQACRDDALVVSTARRAREDYVAVGAKTRADDVDAWLAARGAPCAPR